MKLSRGEINEDENAGPTVGGQELVERGGKCVPSRGVVTRSKVRMTNRRSQVTGAIVE